MVCFISATQRSGNDVEKRKEAVAMSFKGNEEQSAISKRFVSETELEEIKKKREEEWELARQEGRQIGRTFE